MEYRCLSSLYEDPAFDIGSFGRPNWGKGSLLAKGHQETWPVGRLSFLFISETKPLAIPSCT